MKTLYNNQNAFIYIASFPDSNGNMLKITNIDLHSAIIEKRVLSKVVKISASYNIFY